MPTKSRGADRLVDALRANDVRVVFALSGNHIMSIFDALHGSGIDLIHVRHEAACVHMADAYARLTGKIGVALVTGGQGHTNAVAALPTALAADAPVLLLSGHAPLKELGRGSFQELAQAEMAKPVTKASWTAGGDLADVVTRGISLALSGRPGPVHISLPTDLLEASFDSPAPILAAARTSLALASSDLSRIRNALSGAARPIVLAGPMFANEAGRRALAAFETTTRIPALVMESPRGLADPSLGAFAEVLREATAILLLGKPHDFTLKFGQPPSVTADARFVVVDPDPEMVERVRREHGARLAAGVVADPDAALADLTRNLPPLDADTWCATVRTAVTYRPTAWRDARGGAGRLHPVELCRVIQSALDRDPSAVFISDGGEIGQWAQACITAPRRIINGVAGSIGAALPFALAARVAEPRAPVIAVMGDGTFGFHMAEIDTAVRHGLPVVLVIGNDARWNAEHQIQLRDYGAGRVHSCTLLPTRYDQVATALGGFGAHVAAVADLPGALDAAIASGKPAVVNVMIDGLPAPQVRRAA